MKVTTWNSETKRYDMRDLDPNDMNDRLIMGIQGSMQDEPDNRPVIEGAWIVSSAFSKDTHNMHSAIGKLLAAVIDYPGQSDIDLRSLEVFESDNAWHARIDITFPAEQEQQFGSFGWFDPNEPYQTFAEHMSDMVHRGLLPNYDTISRVMWDFFMEQAQHQRETWMDMSLAHPLATLPTGYREWIEKLRETRNSFACDLVSLEGNEETKAQKRDELAAQGYMPFPTWEPWAMMKVTKAPSGVVEQ